MKQKLAIPVIFALLSSLHSCKKDPLVPELQVPTSGKTGFYGGPGAQTGYAVAVDAAGNIYLAGKENTDVSAGQDAILIKVNPDLGMIWKKEYGGAGIDEFREILIAPDGNILLAGSSDSYGDNTLNSWFLKTDSSGNIIGSAVIGTSASENIEDMSLCPDGSILATGVQTDISGHRNIWLMKLDDALNVQWTKQYGATADLQGGSSICRSADGSFYVLGFHESNLSNNRDFQLMKINAAGDSLTSWYYGGTGYEEAQSIEMYPDGSLLLCGHTMSFGLPDHNIYALHVRADGTVIWERNYGGVHHDGGEHALPTTSGGAVIAARTSSFQKAQQGMVLITDMNGYQLLQDFYGDYENEEFQNMTEDANNWYFVGTVDQYPLPQTNVYLVKVEKP